MKSTIVVSAALVLLSVSLSAGAANSQQQKMKDCNAKANEQKLTGDKRKTYMSTCLKG